MLFFLLRRPTGVNNSQAIGIFIALTTMNIRALWEQRALRKTFTEKKSHLIEIQLKTLFYGIETTEKQRKFVMRERRTITL